MILMSDFTTEQLKTIVNFGIDNIKEELEERLEAENKVNFPIKIDDCFFYESEQCVYRIINVSYDRIDYELVDVNKRSIISSYKSFVDRDSHNFDEMIRIDLDTFCEIQKIARAFENELYELRLSTIKSANNIMSSIKR